MGIFFFKFVCCEIYNSIKTILEKKIHDPLEKHSVNIPFCFSSKYIAHICTWCIAQVCAVIFPLIL